MDQANAAGRPSLRPIWFALLLLLDAFALGGLVVWRLVINLLESSAARNTGGDALGVYFHFGDLFAVDMFLQAGVTLILLWMTAGAYVWLKTRWKAVPAVTFIVPVVLFVWLVLSRQG